ncbi:MAG: OmpA family protein [Acidimicrobiia bacterium]|nr:OmpA family protein [Acidimicrobiia bacterium]
MSDESNRSRIRILILAWLVLALIAVFWGLNRSSDTLGPDAVAALDAAGIQYERVQVDGRDIILTGTFSESEQQEAVALISEINGVREVRISQPGTSTTTSTVQTTTTTTTTPETTTTTVASTTTTVPAASGSSRITAALADGALTIDGVVPDPAVADGLQRVIDLIYAPLVASTVEVDAEATPTSWLANLPRTIGVLPIVGNATLALDGEVGTLTAEAPRQQDADALAGAITQLLGPDVDLAVDITVTGKQLPVVKAVAAPDGTLVLDGILPDQATIDAIVGGAAQAYGQDNVTNNLQIGDDVERAFTIFRIPGIFSQFRAVPQWTLDIENGTFSGSLQGGATFASGSAQLTEGLRGLLNIAAGVMARNPQLAAIIEGHTDSIGSSALNQSLSEARAAAGAAYLIETGIDPARLTTAGAGESQPIATNDTEAGRAQNRRLDFKLVQNS